MPATAPAPKDFPKAPAAPPVGPPPPPEALAPAPEGDGARWFVCVLAGHCKPALVRAADEGAAVALYLSREGVTSPALPASVRAATPAEARAAGDPAADVLPLR